jgi:hypothetical protein
MADDSLGFGGWLLYAKATSTGSELLAVRTT